MPGFDYVKVALFGLAIAAVHPSAASAQTGSRPDPEVVPAATAPAIAWDKIPDKSNLRGYEPDRAQRMGQDGESSIRCKLVTAGTLATCEIVAENPGGFGFGAAAVKLARFFKASPSTQDRVVLISVHWAYRGGSTLSTQLAAPVG